MSQTRAQFIREYVAEHKLGRSGERGNESRARYAQICDACVKAGHECPTRQAVYAALNIEKRRVRK